MGIDEQYFYYLKDMLRLNECSELQDQFSLDSGEHTDHYNTVL